MKKLIKPFSLLCLTVLFLTSCQSNQQVTIPKTELKNITFQDNVVHTDFEILEIKENKLLGKLVFSNLQTGRVSFNTSDIIFKHKGVRGNAFSHYGDKLTLDLNENKNALSNNEQDELKNKQLEQLNLRNQIPFQLPVILEENGEKSYMVRIEFGHEISDPKDFKILMKVLYRQLLS